LGVHFVYIYRAIPNKPKVLDHISSVLMPSAGLIS
jgi:hypothetical protein